MKNLILHKISFRMRYSFADFKKNIFLLYKNWYIVFFDFLPFLYNKKIVVYLQNKTKLYLRLQRLDITVLNEIYIYDIYHELFERIDKGSTIIDIGAHVGIFSILAGKTAKNVKVLSFEPLPENYILLKQNIALNKLESHITAYEKGIGKKEERKKLYIDPKNSGGHSLYIRSNHSKTISLISLKQVFTQNKLKKADILKIDCEGAEFDIIYSTPRKYLNGFRCIGIEYSENGNINKLENYLKNLGFKTKLGEKPFPIIFAYK